MHALRDKQHARFAVSPTRPPHASLPTHTKGTLTFASHSPLRINSSTRGLGVRPSGDIASALIQARASSSLPRLSASKKLAGNCGSASSCRVVLTAAGGAFFAPDNHELIVLPPLSKRGPVNKREKQSKTEDLTIPSTQVNWIPKALRGPLAFNGKIVRQAPRKPLNDLGGRKTPEVTANSLGGKPFEKALLRVSAGKNRKLQY